MTTAQRWRVGGVVGAGVLATGIALGLSNAAVVRAPTDFSIYYAAARVLVSGGNPYDWLALQHVVTTVPAPGYVYPLWGLFLVLPLVWLPLPFAAGIWLAANLAALAIALMLLVRLAGLATRSYWLPALFAATCLSIPGLFAVIQGQISLLLLAILVAAFWAVRTDRGSWAGVLLALALLKPQLTWLPALVVLALAWRRGSGRAALLAGGKAMAALCGLSFILRPGWVGGWIAALGQDAGQGGRGATALRANMGTLPALATHLPTPIGLVVLGVALLTGALILAWQARRAGIGSGTDGPPASDLLLLSTAVCLATMFAPWMWIYDGVFYLIPVVTVVALGPAWRQWSAMLIFGVLPWGVRLAHIAAAGGGGTPLNHLEDALIAPLLLTLLLVPSGRHLMVRRARPAAPIPASASQPATRRDHLHA